MAVFLAGCAPQRVPDSEAQRPAHPAPSPQEWNSDALENQPRLGELIRRTPPEMGFEPASTPWRPVSPPVPLAALEAAAAGEPGRVLTGLAASLGWLRPLGEDLWEATFRVGIEPDRSTGIVLHWGLQDDAVAGHDLRIHMIRRDGTWYPQRVEERFHCRRRVDPSGLCA